MALSSSRKTQFKVQIDNQFGNAFIPNPPESQDAFLWDDGFYLLWDNGFKILFQ